jgi:inosine-uridine nucleoside N-ribohydrolase
VGALAPSSPVSIPVVVDTDIGTDIDDTWALALALASPELDVRLITTVSGDVGYRARVAAGLLDGTSVAIATGIGGGDRVRPEQPQPSLAAAGSRAAIRDDGIDALLAASRAEPITIIALGPLTNVAAALERDPSLAERARVVAMVGSVRIGYRGAPGAMAEYNALVDVAAVRAVFAAAWDVLITPLDTCGTVLLRGDEYQRVRASTSPITKRVLSTYREWLGDDEGGLFDRRSTTLYDCVAVHLAHDESLYEIEELPLAIDDAGVMRIEEGAPGVRVASRWRDAGAFIAQLTERLSRDP